MPIILGALCLAPLLGGVILQYLVHRFQRKTLLRLLPAIGGAAAVVLLAIGRWSIWTSERVSPLTQILFVPGLPAVFYFLGLFLGRKLYRRVWDPRVVNDDK